MVGISKFPVKLDDQVSCAREETWICRNEIEFRSLYVDFQEIDPGARSNKFFQIQITGSDTPAMTRCSHDGRRVVRRVSLQCGGSTPFSSQARPDTGCRKIRIESGKVLRKPTHCFWIRFDAIYLQTASALTARMFMGEEESEHTSVRPKIQYVGGRLG